MPPISDECAGMASSLFLSWFFSWFRSQSLSLSRSRLRPWGSMYLVSIVLVLFFFVSPQFAAVQKNARAARKVCNQLFNVHFKEAQGPLRSFFCGEPVRDKHAKQMLKESGLLHIFVVSGAHILLLAWLCQLARLKRLLIWPLLLLYGFATGLEPPVVRALLFILLADLSVLGLHAGSLSRLMLTFIFTLAIAPKWLFSLSFMMSLWASLGVQIFFSLQRLQSSKQRLSPLEASFKFSLWMYIFMLPTLLQQHQLPINVVYNFILGPLCGLLMALLGLLGWLPFFTDLLHFLLKIFWKTLGLAHYFHSQPAQKINWAALRERNLTLMMLLVSLTTLAYFYFRNRQRHLYNLRRPLHLPDEHHECSISRS